MELFDLMAGLAEKLGIESFQPSDDGSYNFGVDDMNITIMSIQELNQILIYSELGDEPPDDPGKLAIAMLQANHIFQGTGGATLAQDPQTRKYTLCRYDNTRFLDVDALYSIIEKFVNTVEIWQQMIADYRPDFGNGESASDDAPIPLGNANFMSV